MENPPLRGPQQRNPTTVRSRADPMRKGRGAANQDRQGGLANHTAFGITNKYQMAIMGSAAKVGAACQYTVG
jgi:hypothetical protein